MRNKSLLCLSILAALGVNSTTAAEENNSVEIEKIEVTGSRIARPELSQPTPIVSIGAEQIAKSGLPDLGSILADLPSVGATNTLVGNNDANADAGISSADLRRLGASRTLVLVNGKRHVSGAPGSAQVDLNTIPSSLISSIEVITGGASAIYGSDAVSGVVNVILRDDFEGFEANIQYSNSTQGVGTENYSLNVLAGAEMSDGRGNVTFFAEKNVIKEVMVNDLRQANGWRTVNNPANTGEDDGIPDLLTVPHVYSERIAPNGVINPRGSAGNIWTFNDQGVAELMPERDMTRSYAFGNFPGGCNYCFNTQDYNNLYPAVDKTVVGSTFNFSVTDNIEMYSDFKFVRSEIEQQFQPSFRFGNVSINVEDNPFLDENLRQTLLDEGTTSVRFAKFFDELGNRTADNERELFRFVTGFEGLFTLSDTDVDFDVYYVYGQTDNQRKTLNDLIAGNFAAALDSVIDPNTGEIACRSKVSSKQEEGYQNPATVNVNDCVAYNPFGNNNASQDAKDWVSADVTRNDKITQQYFGGSVAFDTEEFLNLPGGAIGVAAGFEYREETSHTSIDEFTKAGFLTSAPAPDSSGRFDVSEAFVEISLPLLSNSLFAQELTVDAAYRTADYSHAGNADAWKVGVMWAPISDLRFRGTYGQAVRAPNITEAFSPISPGFARVKDPCDADNLGNDADRAGNCASIGMPVGFEAQDNVAVNLLSGGNSELSSEKSTSLTLGTVWTPSFIKRFSITLDYYDIEIDDAISFIKAQSIVDNCVDAKGAPDQNFCRQVDRDPASFNVDLVRSGYLNAAALTTRGIDAQFNWAPELNIDGKLKFDLLVNHLMELENFEFQSRPDEVDVEDGEVGDASWQARFSTHYSLNDWKVSWTTRFIERSARFDVSPEGDTPEDINPAYVPSIVTHDIAATYHISDNAYIDIGVRNLTDKLAPAYVIASGGDEAIYDVVGRRVYTNISLRF